MSIEAMKQALEALEYADKDDFWRYQDKAITSLRQAIAEAEKQEPVAWGFQNTAITGSNRWMMLREKIPANDQYGGAFWTPLYTTPPQRKPLTDEEIWDEVKAADLDWQTGWSLDEDAANRYIIFARAIEAAHGIKGEA